MLFLIPYKCIYPRHTRHFIGNHAASSANRFSFHENSKFCMYYHRFLNICILKRNKETDFVVLALSSPLSLTSEAHCLGCIPSHVLIPVNCCYTLLKLSSDNHHMHFFQRRSIGQLCEYRHQTPLAHSCRILCLAGGPARWQPETSARDTAAHWLISLSFCLHPSFPSVKHFFYSPTLLRGLTFHLLTFSFSRVA